ncbi:uncharacterized protein AKAW2_61255S [Aspergillus luchuensis]|uniref:Trichothecene 3-O-acetyltransferase-like N-terminal domain-containing protein n=1 Tax=Aspergillus kawachii TaxID=1069201 RepID=A0A7R7WHL4_ASPKA|nr:uncharacterized protein AKAW2_61255S [Aspergillus luchuensis]BCS02991.1 hypothetical protein AKAW2_61255S [Aspergillus luchuensis]BCS14638.1 hypothetical protein ALUC_61194S [Aspergillus luchuensis]
MADHTYADQLTPLDLPMPRTYIRILFVFPTANPSPQITQELQRGLEKLSKQVPWVAGHVFHTTSANQKTSLEIRYHSDTTAILEDKGQITASYANLSSQNMPMEAIPPNVWPTVPSLLVTSLPRQGTAFSLPASSGSQIMGPDYASACITTPWM